MTDSADLALLTRQDVRCLLRCSIQTIDRLIARGVFRTTRIGVTRGAVRIYRASVVAYLELQSQSYQPRGSRATLGQRTAARFQRAGVGDDR